MPWEATLASIVRTINVFEKLNLDRRIDRVKIDSALQTLRQIFFYSSELTRALEDIEAGRALDPEVVDFFANEYRSVPRHIQGSLDFIEIRRFEDRNALLIEDIELMNLVRIEKIDTRDEISRFFRNYQADFEMGSNRTSTEASRILGQIERFNSSIKKLEAKLLAAHHGDATVSARRPPPRRRKSAD